MYNTKYNDVKMIDSHVHYDYEMDINEKLEVFKQLSIRHNLDRLVFLSLPHVSNINGGIRKLQNLEGLFLKRKFPISYAYAGLYHGLAQDESEDFLKQIKFYHKLGFDGMKMLEGKVGLINRFGYMLDNKVYDKYFSYAQDNNIPITLHLADPKEFWDEKLAPSWVKERGWLYKKSDPQFYELMDSLFNIMKKFPNLHLTVAHFAFMSEDLDLADKFLSYPNTKFDLTPGGEQFIALSKNLDKAKDFFIKYQDKIVYGTDLYNFYYLAKNDKTFDNEDKAYEYASSRRDLVMKFAETENIVYTYGDANYSGLGLEKELINKIYNKNILDLLSTPKKINIELTRKYIDWISTNVELNDQELRELNIIKFEFND